MKRVTAALALAISCSAQTAAPDQSPNLAAVLKQGEQVFATSCATAACHGVRGGSSSAPRLAGRFFEQAYINGVVIRGVPDTAMVPFATRLSPPDLAAVVAYVATLNGIANPSIGPAPPTVPPGTVLTGDAARGAGLFTEAARGFGRCATCHEVGGLGIPIAAPIAKVPPSIAELKALATPNVKTGAMDGESMPVLILKDGKRNTLFYDLTSVPPVQRNAEPGSVKFTDGSAWRHSTVISTYNDSELGAILAYLRAVIRP